MRLNILKKYTCLPVFYMYIPNGIPQFLRSKNMVFIVKGKSLVWLGMLSFVNIKRK